MADRDELIDQAEVALVSAGALHDMLCAAWRELECSCQMRTFSRMLIDAGWRPPPSGDAVEQAARVLADALSRCSWANIPPGTWMAPIAQTLADAGLLRTAPPKPFDYEDLLDFKQRVDEAGYRTDPSVVRPIGLSDLIPPDVRRDLEIKRHREAMRVLDAEREDTP